MKQIKLFVFSLLIITMSCNKTKSNLQVEVFETSAKGNKLTKLSEFQKADSLVTIKLKPEDTFQTITGFGGAFTESSAYLLNKISKKNRDTILKAYFAKNGANYSLTRTYMNSCDFSLGQYSYSPVEAYMSLEHFTIETLAN